MTNESIFDIVINDLRERDRVGTVEYGEPLRPFDGRDSLWDAYEEALAMAVYLRKAIAEQRLKEEGT